MWQLLKKANLVGSTAEILLQKGKLISFAALLLYATVLPDRLYATSPESIPGLTEVEGVVNSVQVAASGELEIQIADETNGVTTLVADSYHLVPSLHSWVHVSIGQMDESPPPGAGSKRKMRLQNQRQLHLLTGRMSLLVTNAAQLAQIQMAGSVENLVLDLQGTILAVSPRGFLALQDATGTVVADIGGRNPVRPGHRVRLQSNATVDNEQVVLRDPPVVDNQGFHGVFQKSGVIQLKAGKHPIHLVWFNGLDPHLLEVFYEGPDLKRQRIPDSALFSGSFTNVDGTTVWTNGLNYRCAEGNWLRLPNLRHQLAVKTGKVPNFNLEVFSRPEDVSLDFTGYVEVPRDGIYYFSTICDDGSLLHVDDRSPHIEWGAPEILPKPRPIRICQPLRQDEQFQWSVVEGTVTFFSKAADSLVLNLTSSSGTMRVQVADSSGICPTLLSHSRVRVAGVSQPTRSADGTEPPVAGALLTPGVGQIEFLELAAGLWDANPLVRIGDCLATNSFWATQEIVRVFGQVRIEEPGKSAILDDGTGKIFLETAPSHPIEKDCLVEALGCRSQSGTNVVLRSVFFREVSKSLGDKSLPCLTTAEQVKRLKREESQQGYPVKLRGVVTSIIPSFFLQDATGGIYARWNPPIEIDVRNGDCWEIEGVTFAEFAPNVQVKRATFISRGNLPEPLRPSRDRLINGSLDAEYVEIQGVVTEVESSFITLFAPGGRVRLKMLDMQPQLLKQYENALVRIRGCVSPERDLKTQQIEFRQIGLFNGAISLDEPAPADLFKVPLKRVAELQFFDYKAASLRRVRVAGQILHERHGTFFLLDGTNSLRFVSKPGTQLEVGDMVEAVGFPDVEGFSPILREGVARSNGHAPLPRPLEPSEAALWNGECDGRQVRLKARLTSFSNSQKEQVLELQIGSRRIISRLEKLHGKLSPIIPDSTLEVTGVCASSGGNFAPHNGIDSFELLLNSPADVQILRRPSWWTVRNTLTVLGVTTSILLAAVIWIALLRRKIEKRTLQLEAEIQRREQTEQQRIIEKERGRIARDLHDSLGATLTQIRLISIRGSRGSQIPEKNRSQMAQISEKSLDMVSTLDEIVWALNPANDSLENLATYLCHISEEFFSSTPIRCRLDVEENLPHTPITSEVRHNLYLAVREILNNIAKHSQATEVWFRIHLNNDIIGIIIEDNGCGFFGPQATSGDGLKNIRHRLEMIGGKFEWETKKGAGTVSRLWLPLARGAESQFKI